MSRPGVAMLVLVISSAGCAPAAVPETTTTAVSVATAPEPTTSSTTTTDDSPVDLCAGFVTWEVSTVHVARCFLVPIAVTPDVEGWRSTSANLDAIAGRWNESADNQSSIRFVVLAYLPQAAPSEVIETILAIDGVTAIRDPAETDGMRWVDIETAPVLMTMPDLERVDCARQANLDLIVSGGEPGYTLVDRVSLGTGDEGGLWGLGACRTFRIWAIPISGITVTVVATTEDLNRFDELMPMMDRLVGTIAMAAP